MSCSCDAPFANIGANPCKDIRKVARRLILVPELDASGAKNEITDLASLTKANLQAKFDAPVIADRWFPTPEMENVESVRADAVVQEFNSGKKAKVRDGVKTMTMFFPLQGNLWMGKLEKFECLKYGFYAIDADGNFIYTKCPDTGVLKPIMVEPDTTDVEYIEATDSEVSMVKLTFDIKLSEKDSEQRVVAADDLDFDGLDEDEVYSLWDVEATYSDISTTSFKAALATDFGVKVAGLLETDFTLFNQTTSSAVTISTFAETPSGTYQFDFVAQTSADVLILTPVKDKFDFAGVTASTIVIP
jgi:hypothetical protein